MDFQAMGLPSRLMQNLTDAGITDPSPIQTKAIPHAMEGRDVLGLAQTGTGKTAAFGVPLIAALSRLEGKPAPKSVRSLILAPTRELAKQIREALRSFSDGMGVRIGLVVGGASINPQINRLERGTDVLVATPGRLIDLIDRRAVRLDLAQFLVLDEADQMLDMGFIHDLRKIAPLLAKHRQTMLFSATMPKHMNEIAKTYLNDPVRVEAAPPGKPVDKIEQSIHFVAQKSKSELLVEHLSAHSDDAALIFARTKHGAERLMKSLLKAGFEAASIHGNKSQGQRDRAITGFREGTLKVLVATDVAARGIDIPAVRYVYNYDLPNVPDTYVHRIGRTARAGRDGAAVAYCAPEEMDLLKDIQKLIKREIAVASGRPWEVLGEAKPKAKRGGGRRSGGGQRTGGGQKSGGAARASASDGAPSADKGRGPGRGKPNGGRPARRKSRR